MYTFLIFLSKHIRRVPVSCGPWLGFRRRRWVPTTAFADPVVDYQHDDDDEERNNERILSVVLRAGTQIATSPSECVYVVYGTRGHPQNTTNISRVRLVWMLRVDKTLSVKIVSIARKHISDWSRPASAAFVDRLPAWSRPADTRCSVPFRRTRRGYRPTSIPRLECTSPKFVHKPPGPFAEHERCSPPAFASQESQYGVFRWPDGESGRSLKDRLRK